MKILIKWKNFKIQMHKYLNSADEILILARNKSSNINYEEILHKVNAWSDSCHMYLKKSFDTVNNEFAQSFYAAKPYGSYIKTENKEKESKISHVFDELKTKRKQLDYIYRLLSVCDAIIQEDIVDAETRKIYSKKEIIDLILDKLYFLSDNVYYPIQTILRGNGIILSKPEELLNMVKAMEKEGYIRVIYSRIINVQLSYKGKEYIENKRHFNLIETDDLIDLPSDIEFQIEELNKDIDHTCSGKNLLIRELVDLKSLHAKSNRTTWTEMLKRKLVDLQSAHVINKDAMKKIYYSMTKEELKHI